MNILQLLACLRSLIRKCAHDNVTGDELLKLFPPDLPIDLQTTLVLSFQKFHNQWKQDLSTQQVVSFLQYENNHPNFKSQKVYLIYVLFWFGFLIFFSVCVLQFLGSVAKE